MASGTRSHMRRVSSTNQMMMASTKSITTPTPAISSSTGSSAASRMKSSRTTPIGTTSSAKARRMSLDDDSDDDDEDDNIPQLSDLAKRLLDNASGDGVAGSAASQNSTAGLKRKNDESVEGGSGSRREAYRSGGGSSGGSRPGSPRRDFVTPGMGTRQFRRPTVPSSAQNSGGSSGGSDNKVARETGPNETPAYSTIHRPTGSVARQWQTTAKRPTRGLTLGMPIRGPKRDPESQGQPSPDEMMGQDNLLGQAAPSYNMDKDDIEAETSRGSAGKSSTHSRSGSKYMSRHVSPAMQESSGSPPQKISKYGASPVERDLIDRSGSPQMRHSSSSATLKKNSPRIQAQDPIVDGGRISPVRALHKKSSSNLGSKSSQSSLRVRADPAPAAPLATQQQVSAANEKENIIPIPVFKKPASTVKQQPRQINCSPPPKPTAAPPAQQQQPQPQQQDRHTPRGPALMDRSSNTPHRVAPPPPKMPSAIQMQTARAGAAAASTTKRQNVVVNGIKYLRLDQIGRGGSAKVYRVMAENYKMMALKKVVFEQQDEIIIRGFKGEIDLLRQLKDEDRVVKLYDFEVNEDKGTLTVLLECGELDLNRMLTARHGGDDSQLDLSFIRHYWKEMLECVDAVHRHNIVHSDLKPANFVLVQGRLKLIDFGIANAIQDDTVNVHREQQVGTISYMSPEAIVDYNQGKSAPGVPRLPRLHKLGAPSDVWSLGCILYQMTYGRTPFAHLTNMYSKMQAIPNPKVEINYPSTGIGGVPVPRSLIQTMKGCLERDKDRRVTIRELLGEEDRFLNPDREKEGVVDVGEETLISLLENACEYTKEKGPPTEDQVKIWGRDVFSKLKRKMFERRSWGR